MEKVYKDIVKFNRYKSVESFNNATDVTSSTISIVKLDENVMDIYLGRTKLTHSNFPDVSIELRNLIDSLGNKLNELKSEQNKKTDDISNKIVEISSKQTSATNIISNLKKDVAALKIEDRHIFELISNIENKLNNISNSNSDIDDIKQNINDIAAELIKKIENNISDINKLEAKDKKNTNDIHELKNEVSALKIEDRHIFEILNELLSIKIVISDIELLKKDNENINNEIDKINETIKNVINTKLTWLVL